MHDQDTLQPHLQKELLAYYQSIVGEYREMFFPEFLNRVPLLTTYHELADLLQPQTLIIHDDVWPKGEAALLFSCSWDPEHGVGVRTSNAKVVEVGPQDICL